MNKGSCGVPRGWVHNQAWWLVNGKKVAIFEKDVQRDVFRDEAQWFGSRDPVLDKLVSAQFVTRLCGFPVHPHVALPNQGLPPGARGPGDGLGQPVVEPEASGGRWHGILSHGLAPCSGEGISRAGTR